MKKNKLLKTGALALGTVASVAAPIAAVVSCGSGGYAGRYETENDGVIKIMESFSKDGKQETPLKQLIAYYNDKIKGPNDMKVETVHQEGGYGSIEPFLRQSFEAGDTKKIPNLMINYPDSIGSLVKYDMTLKFDDKNKAITSKFNKDFLEQANNHIGGLEPGNLYAIPFAKSTDMQIVNAPVMAYILTQLGYDSNKVKAEYPEGFSGGSVADEPAIKTIFGEIESGDKAKFKPSEFDIAKIKTDSSELLRFITAAAPLFKQKQKDAYFLGIDAAANFIYQNVYSKVGAKMGDFLFSKGSDGYIKYNWKDKNSASYKAFAEVYGQLQKALNTHAVYIGGNGAYTSSKSVLHQVGISYGSTAGYSHDYVKNETEKIAKLTAGGASSGKVVGTVTLSDALSKPSFRLPSDVNELIQFGHYSNSLFPSTDTKSGDALGHNLKTKDAANDQKVTDFLTNHKDELGNVHFDLKTKVPTGAKFTTDIEVVSKTGDATYSLFASDSKTDVKTKEDIVRDLTFKKDHVIAQFGHYKNNILDSTATASGYDIKASTPADTDKVKAFFAAHAGNIGDAFVSDDKDIEGNYDASQYVKFNVTDKSGSTKDKFLVISNGSIGGDATLQEDEIEVLSTPEQFGAKGAKTQLIQGPSLVGIHANDAEDVQTQKFVNWFFSDTVLVEDEAAGIKLGTATNVTPAKYFGDAAGYIVPTTSYLAGTHTLSKGAQVAFDILKDKNIAPFDNPVDDTTGSFRTNVEAALLEQYNTAHAGQHPVETASEIYNDIQRIS